MAARIAGDRATLVYLRHNDLAQLNRLIDKHLCGDDRASVWYCGDGIYSMYGDVAPVEGLLALMDRYDRFYCYLDDAHGMSTQGKYGRGYVLSQIPAIHQQMIVVVSLAKAFGIGCGAVLVAPHAEWQDILHTCGAPMIFAGPIPPPMLGAAIQSAQIHLSDELPRLLAELHDRIRLFRQLASDAEVRNMSSEDSPIQYIMIGEFARAIEATRRLFDAGFIASVCAYPAVAKNHCGVRIAISRHVQVEDIEALAKTIQEMGPQLSD
jgi:7-keto-8-aminopelargonate synthetase-like enzyme